MARNRLIAAYVDLALGTVSNARKNNQEIPASSRVWHPPTGYKPLQDATWFSREGYRSVVACEGPMLVIYDPEVDDIELTAYRTARHEAAVAELARRWQEEDRHRWTNLTPEMGVVAYVYKEDGDGSWTPWRLIDVEHVGMLLTAAGYDDPDATADRLFDGEVLSVLGKRVMQVRPGQYKQSGDLCWVDSVGQVSVANYLAESL